MNNNSDFTSNLVCKLVACRSTRGTIGCNTIRNTLTVAAPNSASVTSLGRIRTGMGNNATEIREWFVWSRSGVVTGGVRALSGVRRINVITIIHTASVRRTRGVASTYVGNNITTVRLAFAIPRTSGLVRTVGTGCGGNRVVVNTNAIVSTTATEVTVLTNTRCVISPCFSPRAIGYYGHCKVPSVPKVCAPARTITTVRYNTSILGIFPNSVTAPTFVGSVRNPVPGTIVVPSNNISISGIGS